MTSTLPSSLNTNAARETHHTRSPFHQAHSVPSNKKKTVFDCWNGYHSIPLHKDDHHLTTFITTWDAIIIEWHHWAIFIPETFKILGWCPAGSVLPHGEKVPL